MEQLPRFPPLPACHQDGQAASSDTLADLIASGLLVTEVDASADESGQTSQARKDAVVM